MPKGARGRLGGYFMAARPLQGCARLRQVTGLVPLLGGMSRFGEHRGSTPLFRGHEGGFPGTGAAFFTERMGGFGEDAAHTSRAGIGQKSLDRTHRGMPVPAQRGDCRGHSSARNPRAGIIPLWVRDEQ